MNRSNTLDPGWKPTEANGNASILGERGYNPLGGERGKSNNPLLGERSHNSLLGEKDHNPLGGERGKLNNPQLGGRSHTHLGSERVQSNNPLLGERGHNPRLQTCNIGRKTYEPGQGSSASSSTDFSPKYRPATWLTELEATRAGR